MKTMGRTRQNNFLFDQIFLAITRRSITSGFFFVSSIIYYLNRFAIVAAIVAMLAPDVAIIIFSAIVILPNALEGTIISQPGSTFALVLALAIMPFEYIM